MKRQWMSDLKYKNLYHLNVTEGKFLLNWFLSFEKTLMLGKIEGRRRRGRQRMRWLDGTTNSVDWVWVNSRSWWWTGRLGMLRFMGLQRVRHDWATELNWTELNYEEAFKSIAFCFPVVQSVKNPPAMWEDLGLIPGCEDPLEKGTAIHSSILAWKIPRTEELGGLQSMGL